MKTPFSLRIFLALVIGAGTMAVSAAPKRIEDPTTHPDLMAAGFLTGHPDLRHRMEAMRQLEQGHPHEAMRQFLLAARYADKASQAMIAEMLWTGQGATMDRAMAYVWMDLAAERGYPALIAQRERYWAALGEDERARARRDGLALQERYHDGVAKPRLAAVLRRERGRMTGSRTGYTGNPLRILPANGFGDATIDGNRFFDDRYWDPAQYQAWHDEVWNRPLQGTVEVGELSRQAPAEGDKAAAGH